MPDQLMPNSPTFQVFQVGDNPVPNKQPITLLLTSKHKTTKRKIHRKRTRNEQTAPVKKKAQLLEKDFHPADGTEDMMV